MIGGVIANSLDYAFAKTENFSNTSETGLSDISPGRIALVSLLTAGLMFAIILFAGKWLWNNTLVALVPALKPAKSVWQILGLAILISLMHPGGARI